MRSPVFFGLWALLVLPTIGQFAGCKSGQPANAPEIEERKPMTPDVPTCADAKTLGGLDGRRIRLVGVYRKSLTHKKMRGPGTFEGEMHIELVGTPADYDPKGGDNRPAIVKLGPRPPEEIATLANTRVSVLGVLELDPHRAVREANVEYTAVIYGPPQLQQVGTVHPENEN